MCAQMSIALGSVVIIDGLASKPEYNGRPACVISEDQRKPEDRRFNVLIDGADKKLSLRATNLLPDTQKPEPEGVPPELVRIGANKVAVVLARRGDTLVQVQMLDAADVTPKWVALLPEDAPLVVSATTSESRCGSMTLPRRPCRPTCCRALVSAPRARTGHGTTRMPRSWRFVPIRVAGCGSVSSGMRAHRARRRAATRCGRCGSHPKRCGRRLPLTAATTTTTRTTLRRPAPSRLWRAWLFKVGGRSLQGGQTRQGDGREEARGGGRRSRRFFRGRQAARQRSKQDGDGQDGSRRADITLRSGSAHQERGQGEGAQTASRDQRRRREQ